MKDNLDTAVKELSTEDKKELEFLHSKIDVYEEDKVLKKRVARFFLKLVEETPNNEDSIQKTCYLIASFIQCDFGDDLDEAISIAGELELPAHHVEGNVFEMFKKLKRILQRYK